VAWPVRRNQRHAQVTQHGEADFLNHEIAGKTVCRVDDDSADAIAGDAGNHTSTLGTAGASAPRWCKTLPRLGSWVRIPSPAPIVSMVYVHFALAQQTPS